MSNVWSLPHGRALRALLALVTFCTALWGAAPFPEVPSARAQSDDIDPLSLVLTHEDAGADATMTRETQGEEGPARWARRRWERNPEDVSSGQEQNNRGSNKDAPAAKDRESHYGMSGPLVLENVVYVARDLAAAKQVYAKEVAKQPTFPEATDRLTGSFPFPMTAIGDESTALSACNDCMAKDEIYVHRRTVVRKGPVVTVVYTYGVDKVITEDLATWLAGQAVGRIPDDTVMAGGPPRSDQAPSAPTDGSQPTPQSQPGQQRQPAPAQAIQA